MLSEEGLNVIGLPKTIDNDIYGTDVTFGFHTAADIATEVIDRIHTTANSHGRVMVVEIMGNKAGWLTLYAGVAGGADVVLLPEIPYEMENVVKAVEQRAKGGKSFSIIAVAEGAMTKAEAAMKKKMCIRDRLDGVGVHRGGHVHFAVLEGDEHGFRGVQEHIFQNIQLDVVRVIVVGVLDEHILFIRQHFLKDVYKRQPLAQSMSMTALSAATRVR